MSNKTKSTITKECDRAALVPKLRFPEFRDAEGWDTEPMRDLFSFKGNNSLSREKLNYERGSVKNIHYGDIHTTFSSHFKIQKERVPYIDPSELTGVFKAENFCVEGDLIFADASEDIGGYRQSYRDRRT
jgi:type I restriction enzyme, S subunit